MLLDEITLVPPTGSSVTVSRSLPFVDGARVGYLLDQVSVGPPVPVLERSRLSYARGDMVVAGLEQGRDVRIDGRIVAGSRAAVNTLRADLIRVCRHHGGDLIGVRYTPVTTQLELGCVVEQVEVPTDDAATVSFTVALVAPDPVAYRVGAASSETAGTEATPATVVNVGDVEAWPTFTVTGPTTGTTTAVTFGCATTGDTFTLTGLTFEAGDIITVTTRPGFETVEQDGANLMGNRDAGTPRPWPIPVGTSTVYATFTGGTGASAVVEWTPGWVGY